MEAKLIVVVGKASKPIVDLKLPTIIGRGREAGLTIVHPMVSRQHCVLFEEQGLLMVRDLGSTNGTFLQGKRIAVAPLPPETQFTVGPLTFRTDYQYEGDLEQVPPVQFIEQAGGGEEEELEFVAAEEGEEAAPGEAAVDADNQAFGASFEEELAPDELAATAAADDDADEEEAEPAMPPTPSPAKKKRPPATPMKPSRRSRRPRNRCPKSRRPSR